MERTTNQLEEAKKKTAFRFGVKVGGIVALVILNLGMLACFYEHPTELVILTIFSAWLFGFLFGGLAFIYKELKLGIIHFKSKNIVEDAPENVSSINETDLS